MKRSLQRLVTSSPFDTAVSIALAEISSVDATRLEYRRDFDLWLGFCRELGLDAKSPADGSVAAWVAWMKRKGHASKSRARRMSALSSIYRELRRKRVVPSNPFSVDEGPRREKVSVVAPTQLALPSDVRELLATCDDSPTGLRDAAIVRVLWSTGIRRVSLLSMTLERLQRDRGGGSYLTTVTKKGGTDQRVLIRGKAKVALDKWIAILKAGGMTAGPIWRMKNSEPMSAREVNRVFARRKPGISPHMMRVAFLTYNPAGLEAKQDAAGHSDPATTMLYDRASWRGREAFEKMPEVEDVDE